MCEFLGCAQGHYLFVPVVLLEVTAPLPWCQHQQVSVSALSPSVKPE